jgi:hypothetical protein
MCLALVSSRPLISPSLDIFTSTDCGLAVGSRGALHRQWPVVVTASSPLTNVTLSSHRYTTVGLHALGRGFQCVANVDDRGAESVVVDPNSPGNDPTAATGVWRYCIGPKLICEDKSITPPATHP